MIEPPLGTLLVAAAGGPQLRETGPKATDRAAISLAAITGRTNEKKGATTQRETKSQPERAFRDD